MIRARQIPLLALLLALFFAALPQPLRAGVKIRVRLPKEADVRAAEQKWIWNNVAVSYAPAGSPSEVIGDNAKRFLAAADKVQSDMPLRLSLLRGALKQFVQAGQWNDAFQTVDRICSEFNQSHASARGELAILIAAQKPSMETLQLRSLCEDALEGLIAEQNFVLADSVLQTLRNLESVGATSKPTRASDYSTLLSSRAKDRRAVDAAFRQLEANPFDPAANDEVAKYYFEQCGDWEAALWHTALGKDAENRILALRDLARPVTQKDRQELSQAYQSKIHRAGDLSQWRNQRAAYWSAIGAGDGEEERIRLAFGNTRRVGNSAARSGVPDGASALITFFGSTVTKDSAAGPAPWGEKISGKRSVIPDGGIRQNPWEGLFVRTPSVGTRAGNCWSFDGAPLVCPRSLIGELSGFTWTGWVTLGDQRPAQAYVMAESDKAKGEGGAVALRMENGQFVLTISDLKKLQPADTDAVRVPFARYTRWMFVAATLTHDQRLRLTVNDVTKETRIDLRTDRELGRYTWLGGFQGNLDEVAFYPRPLSQSEITAIYQWSKTRQQLVEIDPNFKPKMEPVIYQPMADLAVTPMPMPPVDRNPPPISRPKPKPVDQRLAKPTEEELANATKTVQDVYGKAIMSAATAEARQAIVRKLQETGANSTDTPAIRYVCLREAAQILSRAEVLSALEGWELVAKSFQVSVIAEQLQVLTALQTKARSAAQHKLICERSTKVLDSALAQNDFDNAEKIAALSLASAKATMGESIERSATAAQTRVGVLKTAYEAAKTARETWEADPSNNDAAYAWGEFLCLYKGDWETGLPLVARSASKPLGALAVRDLGPLGRNEQLSLADAWWQAAAEAANDLSRRELRARSLVWYRKVVANISGFEAVRVRKRVEDLQKELSPFPAGETINLMAYLKDSRDVSGRAFVDKDDWELQSGSTIMSPLLIYGSYEYTMNMRWEGNNTGPFLRVPVGKKEAHIYLGSSGRIALERGSASIGAKAIEFKKGQAYSITVSVTADDPNATVRVVVNKKPQISWDGHLDDLYEWTQSQTERVPRIRVQGASKFSVSTMQLKLTDGWVEMLP